MSYYVMELPMVPSGSTYQTGFETGILCAESRTTPGQGRSLCAIDLGQGIKSYACGILLKGRSGDLANSKWVQVVAFSQGAAQGYVNVYSNIFGYRLDSGGYVNTSYGGLYYRFSNLSRPLYTPDNTSYEKWPEDCPIPLYDLSETYDISTTQITQAIQYLIDQGIAWEPPPTDPYAGGGTSGPGGGDGTFDFTSTPIDFPTLPGLSPISSGFINIYSPTTAQLRALCRWLWAGAFDPSVWKKLFSDPVDALCGLGIVPFTVNTETAHFIFGNQDSGVECNRSVENYKRLNFGSLEVPKRWGSYADYDPYTKLEIYLPFIGVRPLSANECMGKTLTLSYFVDISTGACVAQIKVDDSVLYNFPGNCFSQVPISAGKFDNGLSSMTGIATGLIGAAIGGPVAPAIGAVVGAAATLYNTSRTEIYKSGALATSPGLLSCREAYLIFTVPRLCIPEKQNEMIGYPAYDNVLLGDLSGYTEVDTVHLEGIPCTLSELQAIETALKEGVIL